MVEPTGPGQCIFTGQSTQGAVGKHDLEIHVQAQSVAERSQDL